MENTSAPNPQVFSRQPGSLFLPQPVSGSVSTWGIPVLAQISCSLVWVPLSSPREIKGALARGDLLQAATGIIHAFDAGRIGAGPMMTKVVVHDGIALGAKTSATNSSSVSLAWTKITSTLPSSPSLIAAPVPLAMTLTSIPVSFLNSGRSTSSSPDDSVLWWSTWSTPCLQPWHCRKTADQQNKSLMQIIISSCLTPLLVKLSGKSIFPQSETS